MKGNLDDRGLSMPDQQNKTIEESKPKTVTGTRIELGATVLKTERVPKIDLKQAKSIPD